MNNPNWRSTILSKLQDLYPENDQTHGLNHALEVEELAIDIASREEYSNHNIDLIVLRAAALLHDSGYAHHKKDWSAGKVEHVRESIKIAESILSCIQPFSLNTSMIQSVCYLILHHDDTNYSFPIMEGSFGLVRHPQQFESLFEWHELQEGDKNSLNAMSSILKEADGLQGIGLEGAVRTFNYSLERSLPPISHGSPLNAWAWEESIIGNIRLAAKRALLDAHTKEGFHSTIKKFEEVESFVKKFCERNTIVYEPATKLERYNLREINQYKNCRILSFAAWPKLKNLLWQSPIRGDSTLFPYANSTIKCRVLPIKELSPLSKYVLRSKISLHKEIYQTLFDYFGLDIFDLSGVISFKLNDLSINLAPPVVESYYETEGELTGDKLALVDGLHRCYTAMLLGLTHIRVVVIDNVAPQFPLIPLPLRWSDVNIVDKVPSVGEKRKFRFQNIRELENLFNKYPQTYADSPIPPNDLEAKYYGYRDLSDIGSDGIRWDTTSF